MRTLRMDPGLALAPVLCVLAGCAGGAGAASGPHFSRGMWDISTSGSGSIHRAHNDDVDRAVTVEFTPQYGYFVTDRLEVLAAAGVEYQEVEYETTGAPLEVERVEQESYSAAVGVQYNLDGESPLVPFVRLYGGVVSSHRETVQTNIPLVGTASVDEEDTAPYLGLRVGVRYFTAKNIAIDLGLGWKRVWYDDDFGDETDDYSLVLGCAFLF